MQRWFMGGFGAFALLAGCTPSPEKLCELYGKKRTEFEWPSSPEVVKECTKDLTAQKERNEKAYKCTALCIDGGAREGTDLVQCPFSCEGESGREFWANTPGLGGEASGEWAKNKGDSMTDEDCNEAGFAIADKKSNFGILNSTERFNQLKELAVACKKQKKDKSAVANYKCLRLAKNKAAMFNCSGAPTSIDTVIIEACVRKCSSHPSGSLEYQGCFAKCKEGK